MSTKFDDLLTQLGTGKWNFVFFAACACWTFLSTPQFYSGVFMVPPLNYTCQPLPEHNTSLVSIADDSCSYTISITSDEGLPEEEEVPCSAWDFDTSVFRTTLTADFKLVCGRAYLRASFLSLYMFATIFSSILAGYLADRFGRRIVSTVSVIISSVLYFIVCILPNFEAILAVRFLMGCFCLPSLYFLSLEVCSVQRRPLIGSLLGLPWAMSMMAFSGMAFLIRDWRWLQFVSSLQVVFVIPLLLVMDESPRWLIVQGKFEQANEVLQRAARWNKATLPSQDKLFAIMKDIKQESDEDKEAKNAEKMETATKNGDRKCALSTPALCRTFSIRLITALMSLNLFVGSLVYWGVSLSPASYTNDPFAFIALGALMETPAYFVNGPTLGRFGRRKTLATFFVISGLAVFALIFVPSEMQWLMMTLAMVEKLSISAVYMVIIVYMTELFPTEVRLQGIGVTIIAGTLAGTLSPYITDFLGPLVPWAPFTIFGVLTFAGALSLLFLPETKDMPMPDTLQDLEDLRKK